MDVTALAAHAATAAPPVPLFNGDCRGCGECCSRFLPLSKRDLGRLARYVADNGIEMHHERGEVDLMCPYLGDDRECSVYDARPDICRAYRCDQHAVGDFKGMAIMVSGPYELCDMRELLC